MCNITELLIAPVNYIVLEAALKNPHSLEILRRNDSVISSSDVDTNKNETKDTRSSKMFPSMATTLDEKSKLRLMESYIQYAQQQRIITNRRKQSTRDRSTSTNKRIDMLQDSYNRRIDVGNPVLSILIPDQRLNQSYYHSPPNEQWGSNYSSYDDDDKKKKKISIIETTNFLAYPADIPRYASSRSVSTRSSWMSDGGDLLDPLTTDDIAPMLFTGQSRDGWNDTEVSMRILARKYGAREHHVTKIDQIHLRKTQVHNQRGTPLSPILYSLSSV